MELSLAECRAVYERHFSKPMPDDMSYVAAANAVYVEIGEVAFAALVREIRSGGVNA